MRRRPGRSVITCCLATASVSNHCLFQNFNHNPMDAVLVPSPSFSTTSAPVKLASLSSNSQAYVISIAPLPTFYATSASAPSNTIDLFDKNTLLGVQTLPGHETGTTSLRSIESIANVSRPCLISSGLDGSIQVWDERANSYSIKMTNLGQARALLCCDVSQDGLTVAGGTQLQGEDAHIVYWDPRQPAAPLRTHSSTHSDDVTVLRFSPDASNILLSASTDGLISTSTANEDDEDEAVVHVGAWNTSVSQADWIHSPSGARIWASSDMETFSTWSDELDLLQTQDIRAPSLHNHAQHEWLTDYLISCHSSSTSDFKVFVGSNQGDVALLTNPNLAVPAAPWSLCSTWTTGHTGIVRSLLWDEQNELLLTGGEDGKINAWKIPASSTGQTTDTAMDLDPSPLRKREKRDMDWEDEHEGKRARR
ncbi:WD40-repeat-containing domain protein [Mycena alexandri]|uniref:WD40-repeat-containing domain protein n=1 Tax=Mycena alexandri TaxID=1745969 RepID=A0AAD6TKR9_9AGAR|nr:WD40-repeat-containing domain protein [Mycena alexandri]